MFNEEGECTLCGKEIVYTQPIGVSGGSIRGYENYNGTINVYKGIPYAAPPVGSLRWRSPKPVEKWSGTKDCVEFGKGAMQRQQAPDNTYTAEFINENNFSEDCLTLNIWAPKNARNLPVFLFIHGGGNVNGSSDCEVYDGENLASEGIVFISINYRLGIFGYLATEELLREDDGAGNFALLDMIASLQWVQENITAFGGDPENVTIGGQSAGSCNVSMLIASPLAKGLFKNAITMSWNPIGSATQTIQESVASAKEKLSGLGDLSLEELRAMDAEDLIPYSLSGWGSCIDGKILTYDYYDSYINKTGSDVNLLTGMVSGDGSLFSVSEGSAYTKEEPMMYSQNKIAQAKKAAQSEKKTFVYYFDYAMPGPMSSSLGAFHSSDIPYFFGNLSYRRASYWTDTDYTMSSVMVAYYTNFIKTGDPNGTDLPEWKENTGNYTYFNLNENFCNKTVSQAAIAALDKIVI